MIYRIGNLTSAYGAMIIPAAVILLLWFSTWWRRMSYYQRFTGWRLLWEMWISTALISVILSGSFYWYLFGRPFYQLSIEPDNVWIIQYVFPERSLAIDAVHIQNLYNNIERIPFIRFRPGRQYIEIVLEDGRVLRSAAIAGEDADMIFRELQSHTISH